MGCTFWLFKRAVLFNLKQSIAIDLSIIIMVFGFIGARLFHVIYENPEIYIKSPLQIFKFWQGGFVLYGGVFSSALAGVVFLKIKKQRVLDWLNALAPIVCWGYLMGRFATLLSGSGYGRATTLPWGIIYPVGPEAPAGIPVHPTPVYSMLWQGLILVLLIYLERTKNNFFNRSGNLFFLFVLLHSLGRAVIEQFRADYRGAEWLNFSVSTWISLILFLLALWSLRTTRQD